MYHVPGAAFCGMEERRVPPKLGFERSGAVSKARGISFFSIYHRLLETGDKN